MKTKTFFLVFLTIFFCQNKSFSQNLKPFKIHSLWGYKDSEGTTKINPQYQHAKAFSGKYAVVGKNNLLGVVDSINETVIPFKYEYLEHLKDDTFIFGYRAKYFGEYKLGLINSRNEILIEPTYHMINLRNNFLETVKQKDSIVETNDNKDLRSVEWKYGLHNFNGKEIIPAEFDYIKWLDDGLMVLNKGDFQALYKSDGTKLTDFEFYHIDEFKNNLSKVRKGDKYGYIDRQGGLVFPIQFEFCNPFENGFSMVMINNKWGIINAKGDYVFRPKFSLEKMKEKIKTLKPRA